MSNEKLARQWAERIKAAPDETYVDDVVAAAEHILATTTPLTMADVGWDHDKYACTGATLDYGHGPTDVIILDKDGDDFIGYITTDERTYGDAYPQFLTPNGKRYELREVGEPEQPEHPATLVTQKDYEDAPVGTIVAKVDGHPWMKAHPIRWESGVKTLPNRDISVIGPHQVLREGWGK